MSTNEATEYMENCGWSTTRPGLDRTRELLTKLIHPLKKQCLVYAAVSNGMASSHCHTIYRKWLRKSRIKARNSVAPEDRDRFSKRAVENIVNSEIYKKATTVLLYVHTKGELSLDTITSHPASAGKTFCYPLCISDSEMISLVPNGVEAWKDGYFGIREPVRELSREVSVEDIDLVICPCTVFDEKCNRMGMGAGFYDRYLPKCTKAAVCAAAFETQKVDAVPTDAWDRPMDAIFTEEGGYFRK